MLDLARLQWCTPLGEAYAVTGNERYSKMAIKILDDFFTYVTPGKGMPWVNAMDNGIRALNMLLLWQFLRNSPSLTDEFVVRFWKSIVEHLKACLAAPEDWAIEPPNPMAELPHVKARRKKKGEFVRALTKPDGTVPQVGDMDNGRVHIPGFGDWRDHRYLTQLGACYFKDKTLLAPGTKTTRYALWHFGLQALKYSDSEEKVRLSSVAFPKTGVAMLRSGNAYASFMALKNGQHGAGGHSHSDKLSFDYSIGKRNILVDPGQGCYMSDFE
jgi:hypothetical protein